MVDTAAFIKAAAEGNQYRINGYLAQMEHSCEYKSTGDYRVMALHAAAEKGHVEIVRALLHHIPHLLLHDKDELGRTLLHIAAWTGQEDVVRLIKRDHDQKVEVNARAKGDITPLHLAAFCGQTAVVELLLSWWEANLDAYSLEKLTALHMAADGGHADVVKILLGACRLRDASRMAAFINARDCLWRTPLHYGCRSGHVAVVRELMAVPEVNVNAVDCVCELTALHLALWMGDHFEVVKLLMRHEAIEPGARIGSSVNWTNGLLVAEVLVSQVQGREEVPWELLPRPNLKDAFTSYSAVLWTEGRSTVQIPREGATPVHIAAQENHLGSLLELLKHTKTDCNAVDAYGFTALHYAAGKGHMLVLQALLSDTRVNINPTGTGKGLHQQDTPLQVAICTEQLQVVTALCAQPRLRANTKNATDQTALQMLWNRPGDVAEDMKMILLRREDVKEAVAEMQRDRKTYHNSANALLVVGALITVCTFSSWLQPPLGMVPYYDSRQTGRDSLAPADAYAAVDRLAVRVSRILNSLGFYFAVFSLMTGIQILLPRSHSFIAVEVQQLRTWLIRTSASLAVAVALVVGAFTAAGLADLPPTVPFRRDMWIIASVGLAICIPFILMPLTARMLYALRCNRSK